METMVDIRAYYGYIYPPSMDWDDCYSVIETVGEPKEANNG